MMNDDKHDTVTSEDTLTQDTNSGNTQNEGQKDYEFLHEDLNKGSDGNNSPVDRFDEAFNKSSKEVQDYILGEDFPKNISLICRLQKLDSEKENVIVENVAVSILVGLLSTSDAKETLIESFRVSGVTLESLSADMILRDVDAYILSEVRKDILKSKAPNKNIRHLTLKEEREEKAKEELRKILLEKTGNINGRGNIFKYEEKKNRKCRKLF
jgi:hypothetical protein